MSPWRRKWKPTLVFLPGESHGQGSLEGYSAGNRKEWNTTEGIQHLKLSVPLLLKVFPCGLAGKESACNAGDLGLFPGLGRSPGEGKGYPLQYSGLENSVDCIIHGVAKSRT